MSSIAPKHYIYLITTGTLTISSFDQKRSEILGVMREAAVDGVTHIQIREKLLPARLLFQLASEAAELLAKTGVKLLINERADVAAAAGAQGVHLPANALTVSAVRAFAPKTFLVAVSTHNLAEVLRAREAGADAATFGPIFETPGKGEPVGIGSLAKAVTEADGFPVIGVGGIDQNNFQDVLGAGAAGFAAIRVLNDAKRRAKIIRSLREDCSPSG